MNHMEFQTFFLEKFRETSFEFVQQTLRTRIPMIE